MTGAARGPGRSHAVTRAEEGADFIPFDICRDIATNEYPHASPRDLEEAGLQVEKTGRRAYAAEVDVRDRGAVERELSNAVAEFGGATLSLPPGEPGVWIFLFGDMVVFGGCTCQVDRDGRNSGSHTRLSGSPEESVQSSKKTSTGRPTRILSGDMSTTLVMRRTSGSSSSSTMATR
ncbi:hypothetical protein A5674_03300 [Mycobacterium malmoense]|nr:hypothetical protein A5674_03300 [Mycobacterium malmoense]